MKENREGTKFKISISKRKVISIPQKFSIFIIIK